MTSGPQVVGVDLGGTSIRAVLADSGGHIIRRLSRSTESRQGPEAVISRLIETVRAVVGSSEVLGLGLAAAGLCTDEGVVATSPNLPGWVNVPLKDVVQRELGAPTYLGNDANVAALGEYNFGAGRGVHNLVYITVSTGIGGGIIAGGRLLTGVSGMAGEVGHMVIDPDGPECNCGRRGCWEALASGTAIARAAAARLEAGEDSSLGRLESSPTAEAVAAAARQGDRLAQDVLRHTSYYLGIGLVNLVHIFNPELIILGGGVSQIGEPLLGPARRHVLEHAFETPARAARIVGAQLGQDSGTLGAVALVLYHKGLSAFPEAPE